MQKWVGFESMDAECGHSCWGDSNIRSSNNSCKKYRSKWTRKAEGVYWLHNSEWHVIMLDWIKASQYDFDGEAINGKITQIEKECKIEFECIHARTKNDNDESGHRYEKS